MINITTIQEKQSKLKAGLATLLIHGILFLLLYFWIIKTPLPAFPVEPEGTELSLDFGNNVEGTGNTEDNNMGDANPTKQTSKAEPKKNEESNDNVITDETETAVSIVKKEKKNNKVKKETQAEPVKEEEPKPSAELQNALSAFRNKKNGNKGGDGNSGNAGNKGDPNGTPDGDGTGPGNGKGFQFNLKGRRVAQQPDIIDDSQEEGKVVVDIIVDETGRVTQATAGSRGSNTSSNLLYAKARQAALSTKFNPSVEGIKEQRGTITFVFVLN